MIDPSVSAAEREVEVARAKLSADLATLRAPDTFTEFTDDLKAEAISAKDGMVEKAKSSVMSTVESFVEDLKAKAAANPVATLAIGAGVAWRLIQRPPIASVLVGAGLYSLLRTDTSKGGVFDKGHVFEGVPDAARDLKVQASAALSSAKDHLASAKVQAAEMTETVKDKVADWTARAGAVAQQTTTAAQQTASSIRDSAQDMAAQAGRQATAAFDRVGAVAQQSTTAAQQTASAIRDGAQDLAGQARRQATAASGQASGIIGRAEQTMSDVASDIASTAARTWHDARDTLNDEDTRDKLLLGAAALAVAAALGISYQRRTEV